jgi:hypothetical protein
MGTFIFSLGGMSLRNPAGHGPLPHPRWPGGPADPLNINIDSDLHLPSSRPPGSGFGQEALSSMARDQQPGVRRQGSGVGDRS